MNTDQFFAKEDSSDDSLFYEIPRLVTHIDDNACMILKGYYRSLLKDGDAVLDLMSSWVSHLPEDINYSKVSAQGMNKVELEANPQLTDFIVQNLNTNQVLPYGDEEFDLCTIAVSVQYLTSPIRVFGEIARVLKPNGKCCVSFSNRMFPTKAILAWRMSSNEDHCNLVTQYLKKTEKFDEVLIAKLVEENGYYDPLYAVIGKKGGHLDY
jgi:Methylase involved in ubiquinone/menaquinone biosynthesis